MAVFGWIKDAVVDVLSSKESINEVSNPIDAYYDIGEVVSTVGSGLVWQVHDAVQKRDNKKCSVFIFDKRDADKFYKKDKTSSIEALKDAAVRLQSNTIPNAVEVWHSVEEGPNTLAFATEPVLTNLHHIFAWHEDEEELLAMIANPYDSSLRQVETTPKLPEYAKEYYFLDIECRFGIVQIIDALSYIHYRAKIIHGNMCPQNIIITKDGVWKLIGFEFSQRVEDPSKITVKSQCNKWNPKLTDASQPMLNYTAPEVQMAGQINILSDIFSFGLVVLALYNCGKPLFDAQNDIELYHQLTANVEEKAEAVLQRIPERLREAIVRMLVRDPIPRPPPGVLPYTKYFSACFSDGAVRLLQFLQDYQYQTRENKLEFFKNIKQEHIDLVPQKMLIQKVFFILKEDLKNPMLLAAYMPVIVYIIKAGKDETFTSIIHPVLSNIYTKEFMVARNAACIVPYIEGIHIMLFKCSRMRSTRQELLPILIDALDIPNVHISEAAIWAVGNCLHWITDDKLLKKCLTRIRNILEHGNNQELDMSMSTLNLFELLLGRLEKNHVLDYVVPSILALRLTEPTVTDRVVKLLGSIIYEHRLGFLHTPLANMIAPYLAPNAENNNADGNQLSTVMEILGSMMQILEREQKLGMEENMNKSPMASLLARKKIKMDSAPPFCVPNLRVDRKVSSAEEMARRNSAVAATVAAEQANASSNSVTGSIKTFINTQKTGISQWFFGSNNSTNSNNMNVAGPSGINNAAGNIGSGISGNFLRVADVLPNRRLSDNTMMTPKINIAPSSASSPGGTPAGSQAGLPARRHSSIGPQERRSSHAHLSPPAVVHGRARGRSAGSGSSLSVPTTSHPAGGSLPGSVTHRLNTSRKGSGASVKSTQSEQSTMMATRSSISSRGTPTKDNRRSSGPMNASSGMASPGASSSRASPSRASASGASPSRASTASPSATATQSSNYGVRRLPSVGSRTPPARSSPRRMLPTVHHRANSMTAQVEVVANNVANNINNMAEAVSNAMPSYATISRTCTGSIHNPMR